MSISNCNKLEGIEQQQQSDVGVDHRTFTFIMDTEHLPQSDSDYSQPKQPIPDSVHEEDVNSSQLDLNPYQHQRLYQISASTSSHLPQIADALCRPTSDHCTGELEMENEDVTTVVFYPDHMVYRDTYCTDCVLTFTSSCIKIEGSTLDDDDDDDDDDDNTLSLQWGVQDILSIKSQLYELVGMAMVTIHVLMEDTLQAENTESTSGNELKFAIIGTNWYGRQEAITSLNDKYKTLWSSMLESEDPANGDTLSSFTKYFPNFDQPFDDIIYPKGDVDAVSVSKRDVDLLLPDTFVNDTVIDFYIKYLKNKIKPEDKHRFHFFNSFFFRKLADPEKGPLHASEGKAAFQRVRKWTRKVNLFEKDYVFIPVNYNYHWSLIVMCHLGEVATYKDDDVTKMTKVPCVLHMDSIRGSHSGLKDLIQSYLKEEWKGRLQEASEDISSRFDNIRFISLELPQQPNSFDCGLFLLHYVELFLEQAPIYFNPFHLTKTVSFLNVDWFPPAEASLKRTVIQRLVYGLLEQPAIEAPPSMATNDDDNIHKRTAVNFFPETCNPSTVGQSSQDDQGIEISLLPSLSMTNEPCPVGPTESFKAVSEPGSFLGMQFPSFNETMFAGYKSSLTPPIQEDVENGGQYIFSSAVIDLQQDNGISPDIPYLSLDLKSRESWHQNSNLETSISGCEESLEVINGSDQPRSPLMESVEMLDDGDDNGNQFDRLRPPLMEPVEMLDGDDNGNQFDRPRPPLMEPAEMLDNNHDDDDQLNQPTSPLMEPVKMLDDVNNGDHIDQPRSPLMEDVEMVDDKDNVNRIDQPISPLTEEPVLNDNGNGNNEDGNLTLSSNSFEMQSNGLTGSDGSPALESDVQHPMKRMRMAEPLPEGGPHL